MSLMASPVGDVYDGPEVLTISPADLLATTDLQSGDEGDSQDQSLCYALLEFPDSYYPLRVTNVVIGRDVKVQRLMERSSDIWVDGKMVRKHPSKRKRSSSEPEDDEDEYDSDADSYYDSAPSLTLEEGTTLVGGIGGMQVHPVDIGENEQFIAVHPPADERTGQIPGLTSISKQHLRISFKDGIGWTMEVLGRNGAYLNDEHWRQKDEALLQDKDRIMIVGLQIVFRLRGPMEWHEGSVSSDDDDDYDDDDDDDDDDDLSDAPSDTIIAPGATEHGAMRLKIGADGLPVQYDDSSDEEKAKVAPITPATKPKIKLRLESAPKSKPKAEKEKKPATAKLTTENGSVEQTPGDEQKPSAEKKPLSEKAVQDAEVLLQSLLAPGEIRPERRGPGRPPKNGVMSKREMRARQKAVKAGLPYEDALSTKVKGQSRPHKDSEADGDDGDVDAEGRKRKKIRRSETAGEEGSGAGQSGPGSDDENAKELLTPKPPREPTPKEEDFPEERLQKPEGTYQALLHQVLSEAKAPMALQQIYEDVKRRWPYYRFRVQSNGWESSVRHNLQSNTCFMKAGKEGKGHLWTINPNVAFEPKPKRASPPPHPQPYYHHGPPPPGMQHARPGVMHGQMPGAPYAHPYPGPYQQPTMINGHRPPIPAKPHATSQYSSPYSPNTVPPGQQPRPLYQPGQPMSGPQTAPGGGPLKTYSTHPPAGGYRPPPPGMLPVGAQGAGLGGRLIGVGSAANHQPGQPMANQTLNRVPTQTTGHLPNQALSRPSSLASAPLGSQTASSAQRTSALGPIRPQPNPNTTQPVGQPNGGSALEKVLRGQVPEIFTRFKENLRNMPGAVTTPSQELQINQQIDQTIEWIMSNARRADFSTCEVDDQPDGVKATVRILRQMLYDDHRTFQSRNSVTPVPPKVNGTIAANTPRQGVASPAQPQAGQAASLARPGGPISNMPGANPNMNRYSVNPAVPRPSLPQAALTRPVPPGTAPPATMRPSGQPIPAPLPNQGVLQTAKSLSTPSAPPQSVPQGALHRTLHASVSRPSPAPSAVQKPVMSLAPAGTSASAAPGFKTTPNATVVNSPAAITTLPAAPLSKVPAQAISAAALSTSTPIVSVSTPTTLASKPAVVAPTPNTPIPTLAKPAIQKPITTQTPSIKDNISIAAGSTQAVQGKVAQPPLGPQLSPAIPAKGSDLIQPGAAVNVDASSPVPVTKA